jgi:hypothetical protein
MSDDDDINLGRKLLRAMKDDNQTRHESNKINNIALIFTIIIIVIACVGYSLYILTGGG